MKKGCPKMVSKAPKGCNFPLGVPAGFVLFKSDIPNFRFPHPNHKTSGDIIEQENSFMGGEESEEKTSTSKMRKRREDQC